MVGATAGAPYPGTGIVSGVSTPGPGPPTIGPGSARRDAGGMLCRLNGSPACEVETKAIWESKQGVPNPNTAMSCHLLRIFIRITLGIWWVKPARCLVYETDVFNLDSTTAIDLQSAPRVLIVMFGSVEADSLIKPLQLAHAAPHFHC